MMRLPGPPGGAALGEVEFDQSAGCSADNYG